MTPDPNRPEYLALQQRLDRMPIGAPPHPALFALLAELFTPEECRVAAAMPMKLSSTRRIAQRAGMEAARVQPILDAMVRRGLVFDLERPDGRVVYFLNPPIVGFFEFTMMRIRDDIDQDKIAKLMLGYLREDPDMAFARMLMGGETYLARPLVGEDVLPPADHAEILDWERATQVIEAAGSWGEGLCHCRQVARRTGHGCDYPEDQCLSLGTGAEYLIRHGQARRIDKKRALEVLEYARTHDAVQMCDNVKQRPTYICNCCGCCCEMLEGIRTLKNSEAVVTSGWVAQPDDDRCNGCGACVKACPVEAIDLVPATKTPAAPRRRKRAVVNTETCLGCGVCVRHCKHESLAMRRTPRRVHTPETMMEKMMLQALERGKLQHLLFDDPSRLSHRVLGTLVGMILTLPPTKAAMARSQVKSTFVRMALDGFKRSPDGWMAKSV